MDPECYHSHRQSQLLNRIILGHFNPFHLFANFSLRHSLTFSSTYAFFQGREADHSPPTSAEVKKMWIYTPTPPYVFMA
jgi:hypothetical protein